LRAINSGATVRFDVPVPALALGRSAAQKLKRAL